MHSAIAFDSWVDFHRFLVICSIIETLPGDKELLETLELPPAPAPKEHEPVILRRLLSFIGENAESTFSLLANSAIFEGFPSFSVFATIT